MIGQDAFNRAECSVCEHVGLYHFLRNAVITCTKCPDERCQPPRQPQSKPVVETPPERVAQ